MDDFSDDSAVSISSSSEEYSAFAPKGNAPSKRKSNVAEVILGSSRGVKRPRRGVSVPRRNKRANGRYGSLRGRGNSRSKSMNSFPLRSSRKRDVRDEGDLNSDSHDPEGVMSSDAVSSTIELYNRRKSMRTRGLPLEHLSQPDVDRGEDGDHSDTSSQLEANLIEELEPDIDVVPVASTVSENVPIDDAVARVSELRRYVERACEHAVENLVQRRVRVAALNYLTLSIRRDLETLESLAEEYRRVVAEVGMQRNQIGVMVGFRLAQLTSQLDELQVPIRQELLATATRSVQLAQAVEDMTHIAPPPSSVPSEKVSNALRFMASFNKLSRSQVVNTDDAVAQGEQHPLSQRISQPAERKHSSLSSGDAASQSKQSC